MSQMLKSSSALAGATMTSRVLGMVRDIAYAGFMGDGWVAGSFMFAFMVPNLFRRLLGEGALTAAFIPLFKQKELSEGEPEMWRTAYAVISGLISTATILVIVSILAISAALAFGKFQPQTQLFLELLRVMFPYVLLVCLAAIFMGILNSRGHFFVPALGASLLNVVMIVSVLWLAPRMGVRLSEQIFALALGVVVAGILQAFFQVPLLYQEGFRYRWVSPWRDESVRHVVRQMIPGAIGVAAFQINVLLTYSISFWGVQADVIASFNYAVRLMELPQGVFGLSLATYLLPTLAGLATEKKYPEFRRTLSEGIGYLVFINLLASLFLFFLATPMIRLLLERGAFDSLSTARAASALVCLAPGLIAFSLVNILARAFYALGDVRTPMWISVFCLIFNVLLTLALVYRFRQAGMGLANSISSLCNMALLFYALRRKLGHLDLAPLRCILPSLAGVAVVTAVALWLLHRWWETQVGSSTFLLKAGAVFVPMTVAAVVYFALAAWLDLSFPRQLLASLGSRFRRPS